MESLGGFSFIDMNQTLRKKRSDRRPRNDIQLENVSSSLSSSPPGDGMKGVSDNNMKGGNEVSASSCKETKYDTAVSSGHNSESTEIDSDVKGVDNAVKKVKLKVGGVTRTIHAKPAHHSATSHLKQKLNFQEDPDQDYSGAKDKGSGLQGIPWKDFSRSGFLVGKVDSSRHTVTNGSIRIKKSENHDTVKKSKRVPKRPLLDDDDDGDDDDDDDAELRYLAKMKLKSAKVDGEGEGEGEGRRSKERKISSVYEMENRKMSKTGKGGESEDTDYRGEERSTTDMFGQHSRREMTVTRRQKALNSDRDISTISTPSTVEFPHGLPLAPSRKQKDKLSEVEYQLKKAEAAERRRMQAAKAAQESEAEAIRKILGQESSRKKRENKMKQRQEELAQERTSNAAMLASNTVRWVVRPTGTIVTFSDDVGLPNIFESRSCSYPPPREKCAGPSCSKPFKYRDSRSKLPLCSLQCYKAVQEKTQQGAVY